MLFPTQPYPPQGHAPFSTRAEAPARSPGRGSRRIFQSGLGRRGACWAGLLLLGLPPAAAGKSRPAVFLERLPTTRRPEPMALQAREIQLVQRQARTAAALAREHQQKRSLLGVACLLGLGWVAGSLFYRHLRHNRALLATANDEIRASMAEK